MAIAPPPPASPSLPCWQPMAAQGSARARRGELHSRQTPAVDVASPVRDAGVEPQPAACTAAAREFAHRQPRSVGRLGNRPDRNAGRDDAPFRTPHEKLRAAAHIFRGGYGRTVRAVSPWPHMPRSAPWATARHRAARRSPQRTHRAGRPPPHRSTCGASTTGVRDVRPARAAAPRKRRPHDDRGAVRRAAGRAGAFGFTGALTARIERETHPAAPRSASQTEQELTRSCTDRQLSMRRVARVTHRPGPSASDRRCGALASPPNQQPCTTAAREFAPAVCGLDGRPRNRPDRNAGPDAPFRTPHENCGRRPTFFPGGGSGLMANAVSPWPRMTRSHHRGRAVRTHRAPATGQHGRIRTLQAWIDTPWDLPASAPEARRCPHAREDARGRDREVREVPRGRRHQLPQPDPAAQDHGEHRVQRRGAQPAGHRQITKSAPDKPIRRVIASHPHFEHIEGCARTCTSDRPSSSTS